MIDIKEKDILWFFYRKHFELNEKPVERPKNLCNYFWTSVSGFQDWLVEEANVLLPWATFAVFTLALIVFFQVFGDTTELSTVAGFLFILALFTLLAAFAITVTRLLIFLDEHVSKHTISVFILLVIAAAVYLGATHLSETMSFLSLLVVPVLLAVTALVILAVTSGINREKLPAFLQTIIAVVVAWKGRFCPPVNPPAGYKFEK